MSTAEQPSRRTVLTAAVAAAVATGAVQGAAAPAGAAGRPGQAPARQVDNRHWTTYTDWRSGTAQGTPRTPRCQQLRGRAERGIRR
ncbi:hypothetical protein [Streptomyces sp. NPDC003832]